MKLSDDWYAHVNVWLSITVSNISAGQVIPEDGQDHTKSGVFTERGTQNEGLEVCRRASLGDMVPREIW